METIENLVISIEEYRQIVIDKTFVQSIFYRLKNYIIATIGKNGSDTIGLFHTVAQHIQTITIGNSFFQIVGHQIEVLMKNRLRRSIESQSAGSLRKGFIT